MNILVSEVILDTSQVEALIGKIISAGVAELVGVDWEVETRLDSQAADNFADGVVGERRAAASIRDKQKWGVWVTPPQIPERSHLDPWNRVSRGFTLLESPDVQVTFIQIHLIPTQGDRFPNAQPVAKHH